MNKALLNSSNSLYVEAHSALTVCVTSWRLLRSLWTEFTVMWDWRSCRERDDVRQQVQRDKDGVRIRVVDPPSVKRKWLCVTPAIPVHTGAFFFHSRRSLWCFCLDALHLREVVRYWTLNHVISPTLLVKAFAHTHTPELQECTSVLFYWLGSTGDVVWCHRGCWRIIVVLFSIWPPLHYLKIT